jgi:hypothetical protein
MTLGERDKEGSVVVMGREIAAEIGINTCADKLSFRMEERV